MDDESGEVVSVFSAALSIGIETGEADLDGDGYVGIEELFSYASAEVKKKRVPQTPQIDLRGVDSGLSIAQVRAVEGDVSRDESVRAATQSRYPELQRAAITVIRGSLASGATVDFDSVRSLLERIESTGDERSQIEARDALIRLHDARPVSLSRLPNRARSLELDREAVSRAFKRALLATRIASQGSSRRMFEEIRLSSASSRGLLVVGSDGIRLSMELVPASAGGSFFNEVVPKTTIDRLQSESERLSIYLQRRTLWLVGRDGLGVAIPTASAKYPNFRHVFTRRNLDSGGDVDVDELVETLESLVRRLRGPEFPLRALTGVELQVRAEVLEFTDIDGAGGVVVRATNVRPVMRAVQVDLHQLLLVCRSFAAGRRVRIRVQGPGRPVYFWSESRPLYQMALMPLG